MNYWREEINNELADLSSGESGLTDTEAAIRLKKFGANSLPPGKVPGIISVFLSQFTSPLIYILMFASAVVFYIGEAADAAIIILVLIFNAAVGTIQEGKAQNTLSALKKFVQGSATVLRNAKITIIPDHETVPGDIFLLQEGEKVPADGRLFDAHSLRVDESMLTGESVPVFKNAAVIAKNDIQIQDIVLCYYGSIFRSEEHTSELQSH